ncbi:DUF2182 domain-containing protein [Loktanella sp. M215]|nr:DUF2182 domain-containing protein [Loktanella sp. M215]MCF7700801.1 DUF2182 domain-containing protein [Loktanella sp. M215]
MRPALRTVSWLLVFAVILAAWVVLFAMARMSGVDVLGRPIGMNMMPMTTFGALFPMWAVMMAAMMLPTMVPTLADYERLMTAADGTRAGWAGVLLGYFIAWLGFAAVIAAAQVGLMALGWINGLGAATSGLLTAALLLAVGAFQFTRTKAVCHGRCHAPMTFFLVHWRAGVGGGLDMGLRLGGYCVLCCWGFMALGFVGGVMSLLWMGLATLFMVFEKLPAIGHRLIRPAGGVLIASGLVTALLSLA